MHHAPFAYRGWEVRISFPAGVDRFAYAELSFQGGLVTRLDVLDGQEIHNCSWSLSSRACDFIDAWYARQLRAEDLKNRELVLSRRSRKRLPSAPVCSGDNLETGI